MKKRYKGLKIKTWISTIIIILILGIVLIPVILTNNYTNSLTKLDKALRLQAYAKAYEEPELAPLPEREANIALIKKIWGDDARIGLAIARAESGYSTKAFHANRNGTVDEGIFQINSIHKMPDMLVGSSNISYAYTIYLKQGVAPWNSSRINWSAELK